MEINYIVIILCLALTAFLVYKEVKRSDTSRLLWRVWSSILMVISFALLIIPITYSVKKAEPAHEIAFLTEGASMDTIRALKSTKISHFSNLMYHLKAHPEVKKISVYGYGLSDNELKMLNGYQLFFHPPSSPSGILSASWQKKLSASKQLKVQGIYHNQTNEAVKLKLSGFGSTFDSLTVKANTKVNFSFSTQPKQIGKAIFNLIALQNRDTLSAEPIPFEVVPKVPIHILILASSPDFEFKFLKKWLYENQYTVAFRSRISKDKYSTEFLNRKAVNLNQINQALLKGIDLVIADEEELKPEIVGAVTNGMGLIVRTKVIKKSIDRQPLFSDETIKGLHTPKEIDKTQDSLISPKQKTYTDGNRKIIADSRLNGMGKIVTTTATSTYEWQLAGKQEEYGRFWSLLFAKALRKRIDTNTYSIGSKWPTVGEKIKLMISASNSKPPIILVDSAIIAPRQNMELPFVWDGFFWPIKAGWIAISINQKMEYMYSYKSMEWKSAKNFDKLRATENFIANEPKRELKANEIEYLSTEQVSKIWFFLVFLIAISFLWYEQRFLAFK